MLLRVHISTLALIRASMGACGCGWMCMGASMETAWLGGGTYAGVEEAGNWLRAAENSGAASSAAPKASSTSPLWHRVMKHEGARATAACGGRVRHSEGACMRGKCLGECLRRMTRCGTGSRMPRGAGRGVESVGLTDACTRACSSLPATARASLAARWHRQQEEFSWVDRSSSAVASPQLPTPPSTRPNRKLEGGGARGEGPE